MTSEERPPSPAHLDLTVEIHPGEKIDLTLEPESISIVPPQNQVKPFSLPVPRVNISDRMLFGAALLLYLFVLLFRIPDFPIYFFCDEAATVNLAGGLLENDGRDNYGELLPTFLKNDAKYSLSTTVYLQVIPTFLFGKSIWVARGVAALATLLAAFWVGRILKEFFNFKFWWSGPLLLLAAPAWFLLARTAFECALLVTFYTGALYYYLRYRHQQPHNLYPALTFAALAFYTYTPGQLVVLGTALALAVIDWRHHWQQRRTVGLGLLLLVVLMLPFVRFLLAHPEDYSNRMEMYGSVWAQQISFGEKLGLYLGNYLAGINPLYWFFPHERDYPIYNMLGYGHLPWLMLPLAILGMVQVIRRQRPFTSAPLIVAALAAPLGAAMVEIQVTRALVFILPGILFSAIGLGAVMDWVSQRLPRLASHLPILLFTALALNNLWMLHTALSQGGTWFTNYGLDGMQYGAGQVFPAAASYIRQVPVESVYVSPNWALRSEEMRDFFFTERDPVRTGSLDGAISAYDPHLEKNAYVLTAQDYQAAQASGVFAHIQVDDIILYPDGSPGFYFVRLTYREDIIAYLAAQKAERNRLVAEDILINEQIVTVRHTPLGLNPLQDVLDGASDTSIYTDGGNPLVLEFEFPETQSLTGVTLTVGSEHMEVRILTRDEQGNVIEEIVETLPTGEEPTRNLEYRFNNTTPIKILRVEILDIYAAEIALVHLRDIRFLP